jgi:hypothetical protein
MSRAFWLHMAAAALLLAQPAWSQISVVNMIPQTESNEEHQDSEPHLAVDKTDPSTMAATAFTPVLPGAGDLAPLFVSLDGGLTWTQNSIIPSAMDSGTGTRDITVGFGGASHFLYLALIRDHPGFPDDVDTQVYRTSDLAAVPSLIGTRACTDPDTCPDLPWVQAATVLGGKDAGKDRAWVAMNDMTVKPQSASIFQSLDAGILTPSFDPVVVEKRGTDPQDAPAVRVATHPNGTTYSLFNHWLSFPCNTEDLNGNCLAGNANADVVVVRDDAWGAGGPPPYEAVKDSVDTIAGQRVVKNIKVPWRVGGFLAGQRLGAGDLSIAVDPRNSDTVYIVYSDTPVNENTHNLHLRRSPDGGETWSMADLLLVLRGKNPALAINSHGVVGFLYQQVTGVGASEHWETHFRRSADGSAWDDVILANGPTGVGAPAVQFQPYLGDYDFLTSVGKNFYGIFSTANNPGPASFPAGVIYQRNVNPSPTPHLVRLDGTTTVKPSIDPFFVRSIELDPSMDFYARDFTNNPSSYDTGLEPSTDPVFYTDSDVWNRQSAASGGFDANDRPQSELPVDQPASNYAFARISRNAPGAAATVTAHFLYADFGLGVPYADLGPAVPVAFGAADTQLVSDPLAWNLPAGHSNHLCLAAELDAPGDPVIAPLVGHAPGWPTTDLMVLNDNNLVQRNFILPMMMMKASGMSYYAVLHNAATARRDMVIRIEISDEARKRLGEPRIDILGGSGRVEGDWLVLPGMQPGENRWLRLTVNAPAGTDEEPVPVRFVELSGNSTVNGFTIAPRLASSREVLRETLGFHLIVFRRMAALGLGRVDPPEPDLSGDERAYLEYLEANLAAMSTSIGELLRKSETSDPFALQAALARLEREIGTADVTAVSAAHDNLLQGLDAFLTRVRKAQGDPADILLNVQWQKDLYTSVPALSRLSIAAQVTAESTSYSTAYESRRAGNAEYPRLIEQLLPAFRETASALRAENLGLETDIAAMEASLASPAALQKAHRGYLLKLQALVP